MKLFDAWNILLASLGVWLFIEIFHVLDRLKVTTSFHPAVLYRWMPDAWFTTWPPGLSVAGVVGFLMMFPPMLVGVWMVRRIIQREERKA
jgi:hypothetical protein